MSKKFALLVLLALPLTGITADPPKADPKPVKVAAAAAEMPYALYPEYGGANLPPWTKNREQLVWADKAASLDLTRLTLEGCDISYGVAVKDKDGNPLGVHFRIKAFQETVKIRQYDANGKQLALKILFYTGK